MIPKSTAEHLINEAYIHGGTTLSLKSTEIPQKGYVVGHKSLYSGEAPEAQEIARINRSIAELKPDYIGSWYDTVTKKYFIDTVNILQSKVGALDLAKLRGELAIYDLETKEEIRL